MRYVGLDVHQNRSSPCTLDANGRAVKEFEVRGGWEKLSDAVKELAKAGPFAVCYARPHAGTACSTSGWRGWRPA